MAEFLDTRTQQIPQQPNVASTAERLSCAGRDVPVDPPSVSAIDSIYHFIYPCTMDIKLRARRSSLLGLVSLLVLAASMTAVYIWQHHKVNVLNDQLNIYQAALIKDSRISLDKLNALEALPNTVVDTTDSPSDLIAYLGANNTQCYKNNESGYYRVLAQSDGQFAKAQYGCTAKGDITPLGPSPTYILAKKVNNKWTLLSPTNQWQSVNGQELPSCTMVNDNKISKQVAPQCWQYKPGNPGVDPAPQTVVQVTNP